MDVVANGFSCKTQIHQAVPGRRVARTVAPDPAPVGTAAGCAGVVRARD